MKTLIAAAMIAAPAASYAASCEDLDRSFSKYDGAFIMLERLSRSETSAIRSETAMSAVTNIMLRQQMILDVMLAQECEAPDLPDFPLMGLVNSSN